MFETLRRNRVTIFYGVPSLYAALLSHQEICKGAGSDQLRICVSAGEALPAHIGERWRSVVGVDVLDGLGSTEMLSTFLSNRPGDIRYGSTGKPVPGYDARVRRRARARGCDGDRRADRARAGEGYWNQRAKSRRTFAGEWTHTGDKYRRDAEGLLYCGRTDDMFKVSGMWVSPFAVEAALVSHEAVLEAAVIGKEDADGLKAEGFHCAQERLQSRRRSARDVEGARQGQGRTVEISALDRAAHHLAAHRDGKIQRFKLREEDGQASAQ